MTVHALRDAPQPTATAVPTIAVVGIHGHGSKHISKVVDLQERGLATLTALVDPRPLDGDVPWYPDLETLLAEARPDVVVIATPIHTHLALASAALWAGCDVLLEKPTTASLAEHAALLLSLIHI